MTARASHLTFFKHLILVSELTERVEALEGVTSQLLSDVTDLQSSDADIIERLEVLESAISGNHWTSIHSFGYILISI